MSKCINFDGILSVVQSGSANTNNVITLSASVGARYRIYGYNCLITGAASANAAVLTLAIGSTTKFMDGIPVGAAIGYSQSKFFPCPIESSAINTAVTFTITAAGAGTTTSVSLLYDLV